MICIFNKELSQWNQPEALDDNKWEDENSDNDNKADAHGEIHAITT